MSEALHDLDDLVGLWTEEPTAGEREELSSVAARVVTRDSIHRHADLGLGLLIAAGVLVALLVEPSPVSLGVGLVAAATLLWSTWQRHRLTQEIDLLLRIDDRFDLIERQIRRVAGKLLHARLGLWAAPPVMMLFAMLTYSMGNDGSLAGFTDHLARSVALFPLGPAVAAAILPLL